MTETTFDLESYFLMSEKKGPNFLGPKGWILKFT